MDRRSFLKSGLAFGIANLMGLRSLASPSKTVIAGGSSNSDLSYIYEANVLLYYVLTKTDSADINLSYTPAGDLVLPYVASGNIGHNKIRWDFRGNSSLIDKFAGSIGDQKFVINYKEASDLFVVYSANGKIGDLPIELKYSLFSDLPIPSSVIGRIGNSEVQLKFEGDSGRIGIRRMYGRIGSTEIDVNYSCATDLMLTQKISGKIGNRSLEVICNSMSSLPLIGSMRGVLKDNNSYVADVPK